MARSSSEDMLLVLESILAELQALPQTINDAADGTIIESRLSSINSQLSLIEIGMPSRTGLEIIDTRLEGIQAALDRNTDLLRELLDRLAPPAAAS